MRRVVHAAFVAVAAFAIVSGATAAETKTPAPGAKAQTPIADEKAPATSAGAKVQAGNGGAKASPTSAASAASAPFAAAPVEFDGTLESGRSYVGEFAWDGNALHVWRPVKDVKVPRDHAWNLDWTNLAKFPALQSAAVRARPQRFRWAVSSVDVSSGGPGMPWTTIYRCELLGVEPVPGAAPARRK